MDRYEYYAERIETLRQKVYPRPGCTGGYIWKGMLELPERGRARYIRSLLTSMSTDPAFKDWRTYIRWLLNRMRTGLKAQVGDTGPFGRCVAVGSGLREETPDRMLIEDKDLPAWPALEGQSGTRTIMDDKGLYMLEESAPKTLPPNPDALLPERENKMNEWTIPTQVAMSSRNLKNKTQTFTPCETKVGGTMRNMTAEIFGKVEFLPLERALKYKNKFVAVGDVQEVIQDHVMLREFYDQHALNRPLPRLRAWKASSERVFIRVAYATIGAMSVLGAIQ